MKSPLFISFILVLLCLGSAHSQQTASANSERRVALVIGNAGYATGPLKNPVNDAVDISRALRDLGFDVIDKENIGQNDMKRAIREFGTKSRNSDVALFYYAGHAIQVNGENYLVPVGATIEKEEEVEYESVDVGFVLAQMTSAASRINIIILDACRNDPFARSFRSATRGLALMNAPGGTLIAYATSPGSVASDGNGRNGLYTQELLQHLRVPGLGVEEVFKRVRIGVREKTKGQQTPWESSSLTSSFYFNQPNAQVILEEHFDNNSRGWLEVKNEREQITVADGGYAWDTKIVGRNLIYKPMAIDQKQDFRIECKVTHVSGVDDFGYGLVWGAKDTDNLYSFLISADGRFSITRVSGAAPTRLIPWATPNSIKRLNGTNRLAIEKKGGELQFFINDTFAAKLPFESFFGDRVGFAVWNKQQIIFDDLVVTALQR